jgi:hypothetical protein
MTRRIHAVFVSVILASCKPSPDSFRFDSASGQSVSEAGTTIAEGDVLALGVTALDNDDAMDLCIQADSSDSSILEVRRVVGCCRFFIVSAKASGTATLTFGARGESERIAVKVTPVSVP